MASPTIDNTHTHAICDEIGERLRILLKSSVREETASLDEKLDQLSDREAEPLAIQ
jgi:hypothetical protein